MKEFLLGMFFVVFALSLMFAAVQLGLAVDHWTSMHPTLP